MKNRKVRLLVLINTLWLTTLIFQLTNLTKINPECSYNYYIGPDVYNPWGFDIEGTYNWNR